MTSGGFAAANNLVGKTDEEAYYLEVIEKLYKQNELATGQFVALGQKIDLATVRAPVFLLAARDDELVAPAQLFATERLVGTPALKIRKETAPCRHAGLFMGKAILSEYWPRIARWIVESESPQISSKRNATVQAQQLVVGTTKYVAHNQDPDH